MNADPALIAACDEIRRAGEDLGLDAAVVGELVERVAAVRLGSGHAVRRRNRALKEAAELLRTDGTRSTWELAGHLEGAIAYFEETAWPRVRDQAAPDLTPLQTALFRVFSSGARVIRTQRRLVEILD